MLKAILFSLFCFNVCFQCMICEHVPCKIYRVYKPFFATSSTYFGFSWMLQSNINNYKLIIHNWKIYKTTWLLNELLCGWLLKCLNMFCKTWTPYWQSCISTTLIHPTEIATQRRLLSMEYTFPVGIQSIKFQNQWKFVLEIHWDENYTHGG